MTPGQQRAIRELERLRAVSDGCFSFVHNADGDSRLLVVMISIRLGPMESRPGGLQLHEREEFILYVLPGFPFDPPILAVTHRRFALFPHVVWSKVICLYQTALEWNPAGGLYGFFERLNLWLGRAALNDMDPLGGPLEPPHYATDFSQVTFVIRANAPVRPGECWLGLAELEKSPNRMEVVGWRDSFEGLQKGRELALAVMLPGSLPMEFPSDGKDLFEELTKQGFDRRRILRHLRLAALLAPSGEPVYLMIGLPMRRAADGTPRLHLAAWSADATAAAGLRDLIGEDGDTDRIKEVRQELADAMYGLLSEAKISWCRVMEDRPEIVVRRDARSRFAWFLGKRVLVLGCGGLGSWAAEMVARAGAASLDLVDDGIVKPGLLARQNFVLDDIGANKARALTVRLQALVAPGIVVRAFDEDAHGFVSRDVARFAEYDVALDCTASNLMQMKLERDWPCFAGRTPPIISMVTDAKAQQGLCVVMARNANGGPWDAYVRLKHRLTTGGRRAEILAAFYDSAALNDLFQPEPGCSDPTFVGSTADSAGIAASALNLACAHGLVENKSAAVTFEMPGAKQPAVEAVLLDEMDEYQAGSYRVRIARKVVREARSWVRQNNRLRSPAHETGGLLWGMWDDAVGIIWVFDASGPPSDSRHDPGHFVCGTDGTAAEHKRRFSTSRGTSGFVGFWHTHPQMTSLQSSTDLRGMATLVSAVGENQKRALMLIYGRTGAEPTAGIYVYESHAITESGDYLAVGTTQIVLAAPVV